MIIGICGLKRSGKDTVADILCKKYGFIKYSLAEPIKEVSRLLFDWTEEHTDGSLKEVIDENIGISPRQFMQNLGTEFMQYQLGNNFPDYKEKVGRNFWVLKAIMFCKKHSHNNIVIPDIRFPHEKIELKKLDMTLFRISRNYVKNNDLHESEKYALEFEVDKDIENNSSLLELESKVDIIMNKLLRREYYKIF